MSAANPTTVAHCKRKVREIDRQLEKITTRRDIHTLRKLCDDRAVYVDILNRAGVYTPPPVIAW